MGNFQPSIGDRNKPPAAKVSKGEGLSDARRGEVSCGKSRRNELQPNSSHRVWPRWVWVAIVSFLGLWCIGFYVFYVTAERMAYGFALLNNFWHTIEIRHQSWWYWPVFWCIVIFTVVHLLLLQRFDSSDTQVENTRQLKQLRRLLAIVVVGLMMILICVHSNLSNFIRVPFVRFSSIRFPWWSAPLAITLVIALLGVIWVIQRYREENEVEEWSLHKKLGLIAGGIVAIVAIFGGVMAYTNNMISMQSFSFSQSLPWWGWPAFWVTVIAGLLTYKVVVVIRDQEPTTQAAIPKQKQQIPASVKPKGFNAAVGNRQQTGFRAGITRERTPFLERFGLSKLREIGMVVWLVPVGLVLLAVIGYFCYRLFTMEWIDAEGYPISRPWWVWALPFAILALGALIWKVVLIIRENREDGAFRPSRPAPQNKPQKPRGFNMQPPGKGKR